MITIKKGQAPRFIIQRGHLENEPLNKAMEALEDLMADMGMKEHAKEHRKERLKRIEERYRKYEVE
jgi:hypothetical protein